MVARPPGLLYNGDMALVFDDLQLDGLGAWRDTEGYAYGSDAVLLANAVKARPGERVLELCAGNGVVSILAARKTGARFLAVEWQEAACRLARRSAEDNRQQPEIEILCADLRNLHTLIPPGAFDAACCNPPYHAGGTEGKHALSTHQGCCTLEDAAAAAARMLKNGGRFYLTYPAGGFAEACWTLTGQGLRPKRVTPVFGRRGKPPYLCLIECKKGAAPGLAWGEPIILKEGPK